MASSLLGQHSRCGGRLETIPLQDLHRYRLIVQRGRKMMVSYLVIHVGPDGRYRFTFDASSLAAARTNHLPVPPRPQIDIMPNRVIGTGEPLHHPRVVRPFLQVGQPVFTVTLGGEGTVDTAGVLVEVIRMEAGL